MLSLHKFPPRRAVLSSRLLRHGQRPQPSSRRGFISGLGAEFLDLAIALPIPAEWPAYSTAIIAVTVATRLALLPVSIWGKRKSRMIEEKVLPTLMQERPKIEKQVFDQMRLVDKIKGEKQFLIDYHKKKTSELLTARRSELFKQYGCHPWKSMVIPPLVQLPAFFAITIMLRDLSVSPTPFDSEAFLTLSTLAHPDPTMVLPIALGLVTMANVETSNMLMTATEKTNMAIAEKKREEARSRGEGLMLEPGKILKGALRGLSVVRILVAAMMPGSVTLYWLTSATFGLFQTWIMDWTDYKRRKALEAARKAAEPPVIMKGLGKGPIHRQPTSS